MHRVVFGDGDDDVIIQRAVRRRSAVVMIQAKESRRYRGARLIARAVMVMVMVMQCSAAQCSAK